jgi:hypothetical protein
VRHLRRASFAALLATTLLALSTSSAADAAKKPAALLAALLGAKVTSLPHGYKTPSIDAYQVSAGAKSHHALGGVEIVGDGGNEGVIYIVFSSAADAKLDWQHANLTNAHVSAAPKTIPKPSLVANASTTAKSGTTTVRIDLTEVACLVENVIVEGVTSSTTNANQGDIPGAVALELFAIDHLKSVQ